jgi:protein SCO1/2
MENNNHKPVVANYKIFGFIAFVCAALMTSVFVYHMSNKETQQIAQKGRQGDGSITFPIGRDLKNIKLVKTDGKTFNNLDLRKHWTLMFFGFTNCNSVCPVTMHMLSKAYPGLQKQIPNLQVVLVSLDPERDSKATLKEYTDSYNPSFVGVSGKIEEVRKLQSQLGIYSQRDNQKKDANYQLQHTSSIMLLSPEGKWVGIFKFGMQPDKFSKEVLASIQSLS